MRLTKTLLLTFFTCLLLSHTALAEEEQPKDMLAMYRGFVGQWEGEVKGKAVGDVKEAYTIADRWVCREILGGRSIEISGVTTYDKKKTHYVWLITYDQYKKTYVGWYHDSEGVHSRMLGKWSARDKVMLWTNDNPKAVGATITLKETLGVAGKLTYTLKVTLNDGSVMMDQTGVGNKIKPTKKAQTKEPELSQKLAMFKPYGGVWESKTRAKVTDVVKEESTTAGRWTQRSIVNGGMVELRGKDGPADKRYTYLWFYFYDNNESAYVAWLHDERGINVKHYGKWSAENKTMTWTLANPEDWGLKVTVVDDLKDPKKIGFTFKMVADDGTLISDEVGVAVPAED